MNCWYSLEGKNIRITGGAGYLSAETSDAAALPAVLERLLAEHGVPDVVVHLVTAFSPGKRLEVFSPREFQRTFDPHPDALLHPQPHAGRAHEGPPLGQQHPLLEHVWRRRPGGGPLS